MNVVNKGLWRHRYTVVRSRYMQVCHPQHIWPVAFQQTGGVSTLNGPADSDKIIEKSFFFEQLPPFLLCLLSIFPRSSQETWIKIKNSYACECGSALSATALSSSLFRFTFKSFRSNKPKFLSLFFKNSSLAPFFGGWKASTLKRKTLASELRHKLGCQKHSQSRWKWNTSVGHKVTNITNHNQAILMQ